jgi:Fe-coproporphyrin III synthase
MKHLKQPESMENSPAQAIGDRLKESGFVIDERDQEIILHKKGVGLKKIYIELTSRCNLKCITCVRQQWPDLTEGDMDMELFENLLEQFKAFPDLERIHLGGFGEPLAHPHALEIIRKLSEAGYKVSLNTNGMLVTAKAAKEMVESGLHAVYFSIDAVDKNMFDRIRVNGEFNEVTANILALRKLKNKMNVNYPRIGLEFVLMRSNIDQLPLLPKLAKELGAPSVLITNLLAYSKEMQGEVLYETPGTDREMGAGALAPPGWQRVYDGFRFPEPAVWPAVEKDYILWGSLRLPRMYWGSSRRCGFIDNHATVIRHDGSVSPCYALMYSYSYYLDNRQKDVTEYVAGSVKENDLADIWNSPEYIRFRYRVRNYNFPSCMDCANSKICDYADQNEDCWGNVPSCADCLWSQGIVRCP